MNATKSILKTKMANIWRKPNANFMQSTITIEKTHVPRFRLDQCFLIGGEGALEWQKEAKICWLFSTEH